MSTAEQKKENAAKAISTNEKKWGKALMNSGWTAFPSIILEKQHALGLDALDINIILYLSTYWWEADNKPHPSKRTIAEALNVTDRTIQRRIAALEKVGFMWREYRPDKEKGNKSNVYHFDGLIKAAEPYAEEKMEANEARREELEARRTRKKTKTTVFTAIDGGKKS
jgi:predicted transcriptional regulator